MSVLTGYYKDELNKLGNPREGYAPSIKITGAHTVTNCMTLNNESATILTHWLNDHYQTGVTLVNNEQRVFQIVKSDLGPKHWFVNLAGIPAILQALRPHDKFTVYEFWDTKPRRVTKKALNGMFEANQIDFRIK